mmetsp:Transcript_19938/g.50275  ORF Transcript_19938/g.50275 Transcript_19938/m.50275 type:complete len:295 (-) Transcript_19938:664-1548(-)
MLRIAPPCLHQPPGVRVHRVGLCHHSLGFCSLPREADCGAVGEDHLFVVRVVCGVLVRHPLVQIELRLLSGRHALLLLALVVLTRPHDPVFQHLHVAAGVRLQLAFQASLPSLPLERLALLPVLPERVAGVVVGIPDAQDAFLLERGDVVDRHPIEPDHLEGLRVRCVVVVLRLCFASCIVLRLRLRGRIRNEMILSSDIRSSLTVTIWLCWSFILRHSLHVSPPARSDTRGGGAAPPHFLLALPIARTVDCGAPGNSCAARCSSTCWSPNDVCASTTCSGRCNIIACFHPLMF